MHPAQNYSDLNYGTNLIMAVSSLIPDFMSYSTDNSSTNFSVSNRALSRGQIGSYPINTTAILGSLLQLNLNVNLVLTCAKLQFTGIPILQRTLLYVVGAQVLIAQIGPF